MSEDHPKHRLYGRAAGKPLSKTQTARLDTLLPKLAVPEGPLDPLSLFPGAREAWLEIGFGGGEHLAGQAAAHPQAGIIGVEPFLEGVAKLLAEVEQRQLSNILIRRGDARDLVAQIQPASLARVFILFPDPWPKTRHRKRRLIQPDFVAELARVMKPGARLRFATDWADYASRALADINRSGVFTWTAEQAGDWRKPPADHVTTRYQEKRLGDCEPVFLDFVRR
ncbi:MAG TPA: tRNA (guanosine(46)-N7)-methyltransferase TrmB [Hyphomonadaceae bacterium]|jgi:tRNA (guanine-N7-)-methyltransferase|nr:tRNA (guanosine(46)-N7)-methyltransferase TrmB [Hyphomonadaceae bacterium]